MSRNDEPCRCDQVLQHSTGVWAVDEAVAKARRERVPAESDRLLWCLERLLAACQRLAERIGRSDFPMPLSTVARILEIDSYKAWRLVHAFVQDGVLVKVSMGRVGDGGPSGQASRWQYTRPPTLFDEAPRRGG
jgi:hypothetical protein